MKTIIVFIIILVSNALSSQIITGLSATQNGTNQIKTTLKVQLSNWGEFSSYNISIDQNLITLSACYYMSGATAIVNLENDFYISVPDNKSYSLVANLYLLGQQSCNYNEIEDTATLNFSTPIQGTVSLGTNETNAEADIKVIPIPAKEELTILTKNKIENVAIYDASGKKLPVLLQNNKINTSKLQNGTYFLEIVNDKKRIHRKFTVQK